MIVVVLLVILAGSFSTAIYFVSTGASWGMVALGYVAGGWGGLLLGGALALLGARLVPNRSSAGARSADISAAR